MKIEEEIKSSFKNDYHKLAVNIHLTSARIGETFASEIKKRGLTSTQYNVLRILRGQNGNPICIGTIKERMIERSSDVSRIIERLVKKELIKSIENESDRRLKDITISDLGSKILEEIDVFHSHIDKEFEHLTNEEVEILNNLLDKARNTKN